MSTPDQQTLDRMTNKREVLRKQAEDLLLERRASGVEELRAPDATRFRAMTDDLHTLDSAIDTYRSELERVGEIPQLGKLSKRTRSGAHVAPLGFEPEQLRRAYERLTGGEAVRLEARAYTSATPILPAELAPWVTEMVHEGRILDKLPAVGMTAPSIEIIQVNTVNGAASRHA